MPHRCLTALGTPSVHDARRAYGSDEAVERMAAGVDTDARLGPGEIAFVEERDGFYITQRWSRPELAPALDGLRSELDELRAENERLRAQLAAREP